MVQIWEQFNKLCIVKILEVENWRRKVLCKCECWNIKKIRLGDVQSGNTKSCWCLFKKRKHWKSKSKIYEAWQHMKTRCRNKNFKQYKDYWWRGIKVLWKNFEEFYKDVWDVPEGMTIERIDNNWHYCKKNCRWASRLEQARNTRKTILIERNWETKTLRQWSLIEKIPYCTLRQRYKAGWWIEKMFSKKNFKYKQYV